MWFFLLQLSVLVTFATRMHCWLIVSLVPIRFLRAFRLSCSPACEHAACSGTWSYSSGAGWLYTLFHWTSWGFCQLFFQFFKILLSGRKLCSVFSHSSQFCNIWKKFQFQLLRVHSVPSFIIMLNSIVPSIHPWNALPLAGLQLNFLLLTTTLWPWQFSQVSVHCSLT